MGIPRDDLCTGGDTGQNHQPLYRSPGNTHTNTLEQYIAGVGTYLAPLLHPLLTLATESGPMAGTLTLIHRETPTPQVPHKHKSHNNRKYQTTQNQIRHILNHTRLCRTDFYHCLSCFRMTVGKVSCVCAHTYKCTLFQGTCTTHEWEEGQKMKFHTNT